MIYISQYAKGEFIKKRQELNDSSMQSTKEKPK